MKRLLLLALLLPLAALAQTAPAQLVVTWTPPTQNTDNSTPVQLSGYNLYISTTDAALTALGTVTTTSVPVCKTAPFLNCAISLPATATTYTTSGFVVGNYTVALTSFNCPTGSACTESPQSIHVPGTIPTTVVVPAVATPKAPGSVTVTSTASVTATATSK